MQPLCEGCGAAADARALVCERCGELLHFPAPHLDDAPAARARFRARRASDAPLDRSGVWRFRELLPPIAEAQVVTLRENVVAPLELAAAAAAYAEVTRANYLHLGTNPTASFKDAGMTVAISAAKAAGARLALCASTGNTGASMAAYAARAGLTALVLVPAGGVSEAKLAQTLDYGATALAIEGDFDRALALARELPPREIALVNSLNPYRIEGQKCAAFALLEARGWEPPDWIVLPGGNLGNASAFGKGFREARALGFCTRIPRIAVVQASGAAPFVHVFRDGGELVPVVARTAASAIRIGAPASWKRALAELRESDGTALAVDDDEIAEARAAIGRDGVGCEPASAAALAGLRRLRAGGEIGRDEDVVVVLTGHLLKDPAYAAQFHASAARGANPIVHASGLHDARERIARLLERAQAGRPTLEPAP